MTQITDTFYEDLRHLIVLSRSLRCRPK